MPSPNAPDQRSVDTKNRPNSPDYVQLVRFLCEPFLDSSDSLRLDCESSPRTKRVLIRLAIEGEDKGRVFGRGGRNLQAIRTVLQSIAKWAGQSVNIEIFGSSTSHDRPSGPSEGGSQGEQSSPTHRRRPSKRQRVKGS